MSKPKLRWLRRHKNELEPRVAGTFGGSTRKVIRPYLVLQYHDGKKWRDVPEENDELSYQEALQKHGHGF